MLSDVLQRTFGEFGARLQAFAPNLLAMLVLLATVLVITYVPWITTGLLKVIKL